MEYHTICCKADRIKIVICLSQFSQVKRDELEWIRPCTVKHDWISSICDDLVIGKDDVVWYDGDQSIVIFTVYYVCSKIIAIVECFPVN